MKVTHYTKTMIVLSLLLAAQISFGQITQPSEKHTEIASPEKVIVNETNSNSEEQATKTTELNLKSRNISSIRPTTTGINHIDEGEICSCSDGRRSSSNDVYIDGVRVLDPKDFDTEDKKVTRAHQRKKKKKTVLKAKELQLNNIRTED